MKQELVKRSVTTAMKWDAGSNSFELASSSTTLSSSSRTPSSSSLSMCSLENSYMPSRIEGLNNVEDKCVSSKSRRLKGIWKNMKGFWKTFDKKVLPEPSVFCLPAKKKPLVSDSLLEGSKEEKPVSSRSHSFDSDTVVKVGNLDMSKSLARSSLVGDSNVGEIGKDERAVTTREASFRAWLPVDNHEGQSGDNQISEQRRTWRDRAGDRSDHISEGLDLDDAEVSSPGFYRESSDGFPIDESLRVRCGPMQQFPPDRNVHRPSHFGHGSGLAHSKDDRYEYNYNHPLTDDQFVGQMKRDPRSSQHLMKDKMPGYILNPSPDFDQDRFEPHVSEPHLMKLLDEEKKKETAMELLDQYLLFVQEADKGTKKSKNEKDPSKLYSNERRGALLGEGRKLLEASKVIGEEWKSMTGEQKRPCEEIAKVNKEKYQNEKEMYEQKKEEETAKLKKEEEEMMKIHKVEALQVCKKKEKTENIIKKTKDLKTKQTEATVVDPNKPKRPTRKNWKNTTIKKQRQWRSQNVALLVVSDHLSPCLMLNWLC